MSTSLKPQSNLAKPGKHKLSFLDVCRWYLDFSISFISAGRRLWLIFLSKNLPSQHQKRPLTPLQPKPIQVSDRILSQGTRLTQPIVFIDFKDPRHRVVTALLEWLDGTGKKTKKITNEIIREFWDAWRG